MYIVELQNGAIKTEIHGLDQKMKSGNVVKGINCIDSFSFSIIPFSTGFNAINDFQTLVTVFNTNKNRYEFQGRVLYSKTDMDKNGLITKEVTCESFFGFLCDSVQKYVEEKNWNVRELLQHIIDTHNSQVEEYKRFAIGEVSEDLDPNDNLYVGIQRENSWKTVEEKLLNKLGGEIRFRVVDGVIYLDYLKKIGVTRATKIELSRNMKAITRESDPSSFITRLIPLGAKLTKTITNTDSEGNETTETVTTEERLDITSVNNGVDYIDNDVAIQVYGIHVGYVEFDDVKDASNLLRKGNEWLAENSKVQVKYSITALDLSLLGLDIDDFDVHNYHPIVNPLLGIDDTARIIKKNINICEEIQSTIEVGDNFKTLSDLQMEQAGKLDSIINNVTKLEGTTNNLKDKVSNVETKVNRFEGIDDVYFYVKYSQYEDGHEMTDTPDENTVYMGTCSTNEPTAPKDYTKYTWCKVRGNDGTDGTPGVPGSDGQSQFFHVKYSDDGKTFTSNGGETLGKWMGTCVDNSETDPTAFSAYTWRKIVGEDGKNGIDGVDGTDGHSSYFYVKFSANANGNPMTEAPDSNTKYMGVCSTTSATAPTNYSAYKWTQCRGNDGTNGTPGEPGADGRTQYLHIKYSDDGKTFTSNNGEEIGAWIGTLVDFVEADSTNFNDYTWKKFTGDVQVGGRNLLQKSNPVDWSDEWLNSDSKATAEIVDGWLKVTQGTSNWFCRHYPPEISTFPAGDLILSFEGYADSTKEMDVYVQCSANGWTKNIDNVIFTTTPTRYVYPFTLDQEWKNSTVCIGTFASGSFYIRNIKVETGNIPTDWTPAPEDIGSSIGASSEQIYQTMLDQNTTVLNTAESIILSALERYVETSNYEEFKRTLQTELEVWAGGIGGRVTETEESIKNVDGDLQSKFNTITKYFTFDINGLTIGQVDNPNKVVIDNDQISILVNNIPVQEFKADGTALIPILKITEIMNLLCLQITEDATHINCDYLGV